TVVPGAFRRERVCRLVGRVSLPRPPGGARLPATVRRTRQRAHPYRAGAARHPAAKLPWIAAAIPDRLVLAAGTSRGRETEPGWCDCTGGQGDHRRPRRGPGVADVDGRTQRTRTRG